MESLQGTYSIVLLDVVDSDYKFVIVYVGAYGKQSDGGVLQQSKFGRRLEKWKLQLPVELPLPNTTRKAPCVFVGGEAFQLRPDFLRLYPGRGLQGEKRVFNYRLSRDVSARMFRLRRLNTKPNNYAQPSHLVQSMPEPLCSHSATQWARRPTPWEALQCRVLLVNVGRKLVTRVSTRTLSPSTCLENALLCSHAARVLHVFLRKIAAIEDFFRGSNLVKGQHLLSHVADAKQVIADDAVLVRAKCVSQMKDDAVYDVELESQPFRAAKPAERQQPRSEQSTPQSSRGATLKTRISELPAEQQEATYAAISAQYGAPAFCSGQDLSQAVCYQCHASGHLASKCPTRTSRLSSSAPPTMPMTQQPLTLHSAPVTLDGSQQQCPFFNATLSGVGECEVFPDSGSKVTLVSKACVPASMIIPWTEPPLVVVGGSTVLPVGAAFLNISIGAATGVVEAAVLEDNVLPLIIGEDCFSAAQARLIFEPPKPAQLQHTAPHEYHHYRKPKASPKNGKCCDPNKIDTLAILLDDKLLDSTERTQEVSSPESTKDCILDYLGGYVARKFAKISCKDCLQNTKELLPRAKCTDGN
ncbi:hypothetical protein HPB50_015244 [Hyalomma asiaticum]|uniref:Uncharacterized protein n=1 Tax=Hyalomma asiaticum TaxID=266040 RepID=A0ACB7SHE4_HYAAI|nr:hypothetical protein HPB50_015244 [Hyalomma asiaticum]